MSLKRAVGTRAAMAIPQGPNQLGSFYFVSDSLFCGRRFRILTVIHDFSRECLAAVVYTLLSDERVARELGRIAEIQGYPCMVVSYKGTELSSNAILKWQEDGKVGWHDIASRCRAGDCLAICREGANQLTENPWKASMAA